MLLKRMERGKEKAGKRGQGASGRMGRLGGAAIGTRKEVCLQSRRFMKYHSLKAVL